MIDTRNPTAREGPLFEEGDHSLLFRVRVKGNAASIDVSRNEKPHLSWTGERESLGLSDWPISYPGLNARRSAMLMYNGPTSLNRVGVRLVSP